MTAHILVNLDRLSRMCREYLAEARESDVPQLSHWMCWPIPSLGLRNADSMHLVRRLHTSNVSITPSHHMPILS